MKEQQKDYIAQTEKEKEKIKAWNCSDRLSMLSKLTFLNGSLAASVTGWAAWFGNAQIIEYLNDAEFKELLDAFQKLTIDLLDLDIKYSKCVKQKQEELLAKQLEEEKKKLATLLKNKLAYTS